MSELVAVGVNFRGAPVELREKLAIDGTDQAALLAVFREVGMREVMLVSTCNRVELYGLVDDLADAVSAFDRLASVRSVEPTELRQHLFVRRSSDAARHIFRVAASLDSLVVGEPQILGQVKDAFAAAKSEGSVGPVLERCLTLAFKCAKRVRSETEIARGAANVSSVAVELAATIFGDLQVCRVLVVGAGEMAEQAALHLRAAKVAEIIVVNRTDERGRRLAERVHGRHESWTHLDREMARADVVITSTGSTQPIIDRAFLRPIMKVRRQRPIFLVDIAVPRDVAADVTGLDHVFPYNVDDLQGIVHDNLRIRKTEADRAETLVEDELGAFLGWMRTRAVGPLIAELQRLGREIVDGEVQRTLQRLPGLDDKQRAAVEQLGRGVMQKLLHTPMVRVRQATAEGGPALAEALQTLFALEPAAGTVRDSASTPARVGVGAGVGGGVGAAPGHVAESDSVPRPEPS